MRKKKGIELAPHQNAWVVAQAKHFAVSQSNVIAGLIDAAMETPTPSLSEVEEAELDAILQITYCPSSGWAVRFDRVVLRQTPKKEKAEAFQAELREKLSGLLARIGTAR